MRRALAAAALALVLSGGCARAGTFAQHPGFAAWFERHPPSPTLPPAADRALLQQHRPRLFVPPSAPGPLDFYRDYIAFGSLETASVRIERVDRERLRAHATDPEAVFRHRPGERTPAPVAYGRVDREPLPPFGELTFLTWHFVFRHSGLPAELPAWQELLAATFGDPDDWHQLDHYTAATLALAPGGRPLALILQQHNHLRSYWLGPDLRLPADGRPRLAAAVRSNELYPRPDTTTHPRAVRFLEADNLRWLATGNDDRPWSSGHDRVEPGRSVDYTLEFLPQTDPFYRFHGRLGKARLLPGRDGPPGADYKTLPAYLSRVLQLCAFRWPRPARTADVADLQALLSDPDDAAARARLFARCRGFIRARLAEPARAIGYNAGLARAGSTSR